MRIYRIYTTWMLSLIFVLLIMVAIINYFVDPAREFHYAGGFESNLGAALLKDKTIALAGDYNERKLAQIMLNNLKHQPSVLVLGSSRIMMVGRSALINSKALYNASVSGASLEDDVALYYLYQKRGWVPKAVIIGLDPWLLNKNNKQVRWKILREQYYQGTKILSHSSNAYGARLDWVIQKYSELISIGYFRNSIIKLIQTGFMPVDWQTYNEDDVPHKLSNGILLMPKKDELISFSEAQERGRQYAGNIPVYSLGGYYNLDQDAKRLLESFVDYLIKKHVNVIFYLPPYEPKAFEMISNNADYKIIKEAERYFVKMARQKNLKLIGSYNPSHLGLTADDFMDGMHLKAKGINKVFDHSFYAYVAKHISTNKKSV